LVHVVDISRSIRKANTLKYLNVRATKQEAVAEEIHQHFASSLVVLGDKTNIFVSRRQQPMESIAKRGVRVAALTVVAFFTAQFVEARPARTTAANGHSGTYAQQPAAPQKPQKPRAAERTPAQGAVPEAGMDEENLPPDIAQQMNDLRHQVEQEALNRMRSGRWGYNGYDLFLNDVVPFLIFVGVTLALLWILRTILDNRRWYKMVKVQTETHAKLLDRFGSSQDMLAYMSSEAGKKFLESPIFEGQRQQVSTLPFGRILWSTQIGIIGMFLGAGIMYLRGRVPANQDTDTGLLIFGTLILFLGVGFLVSGGVSYVLAKYFGLLERHEAGLARSERNA
jgi:hypothetical protein